MNGNAFQQDLDGLRAVVEKLNLPLIEKPGYLPPQLAACMDAAGWHFSTNDGDLLYRYENGVYRPFPDNMVFQAVSAFLAVRAQEWFFASPGRTAAPSYLRSLSPYLEDRPDPDILNVLNGRIEIDTGKLIAHDPDVRTLVQLQTTYDPKATDCPTWDKIFADVLKWPDGEPSTTTADTLWEMVASNFNGYIEDKIAWMLYGPANNGKSTLLKALTGLLGPENVTGMSLERIESRFDAARLYGKLANICPDLPPQQMKTSAIFKQITGGDPIVGEVKFGKVWEFYPFCRLTFSTNFYPKSDDASPAYFNRWLVIPMNNVFPTNSNLKDEFLARMKEERPAAMNKALVALRRLRENSYQFTVSDDMRKGHAEFSLKTDPIGAYVRDCIDFVPDERTLKTDVYEDYQRWGREKNIPFLADQQFSRRLHELFAERFVDGKDEEGRKLWTGVALRLVRSY